MSDKSTFNSISDLMDGYNPQRQLLEQTRQLVKKWEPTGLLEGMGAETKTHGIRILKCLLLKLPYPNSITHYRVYSNYI